MRIPLKRLLFGLLLIGIGVFVFASVFTAPRAPQTLVVTRTARGFEPATVTIRVGDTAQFVSNADAQFWPASDFHPTHKLYPEFDPLRALAPGEQWNFTFERAGTWTYHDHLSPQTHGTIIVEGSSSESAASCVASSTALIKSYCWAGLFTTTIRERGLGAALDQFAKLYAGDPAFQQNCHDIMHILGKAGYDQFKKDGIPVIRPETSYCGYGFYHGFIEEMFAQNGSLQLADGTRYCKAVQTSSAFPSASAALTATYACFHGLGHASLDSLDAQFWGNDSRMVDQALKECESASPQEFQASCASGVFNSLAIAYSARTYGLSFRDPDPTSICRSQKADYQRPCYEEVSIGYLREKRYSFSAAMKFIQNLSAHRGDVIYGYIDDYIRHDMSDPAPEAVMPLCAGLTVQDEKENCVHSILHAFIATGEPGKEEEKAIPYCKLLDEGSALRSYCFKEIGTELSNIKSYARVQEICSTLMTDDAAACNSTSSFKH